MSPKFQPIATAYQRSPTIDRNQNLRSHSPITPTTQPILPQNIRTHFFKKSIAGKTITRPISSKSIQLSPRIKALPKYVLRPASFVLAHGLRLQPSSISRLLSSSIGIVCSNRFSNTKKTGELNSTPDFTENRFICFSDQIAKPLTRSTKSVRMHTAHKAKENHGSEPPPVLRRPSLE